MKSKVGPAAIVAAVVILALLMYGMYKVAFQPQSPEPSPLNAPAYVKRAGMPGAAAPGSADPAVSYQQGSQYTRHGPGSMGATSGAFNSSGGH